jgi:hypothetical protein
MKVLHPRTARLIRHRDSLRAVACGPHRNGMYSAYLLFPAGAGGDPIVRTGAVYDDAEAAVAGLKGLIAEVVGGR